MCDVLGKYCTVARLMAALDLRQVDLLESLGELETARLIRADGDRIAIAHGLVAEAVAQNSPAIALRAAHFRVASMLDAEARMSASASTLWDCAEHWAAAAEHERALAAFRACA